MAKVKKAYFCKNCGFEAPKWLGRCPSCGEWNTFTEEIVARDHLTTLMVTHNMRNAIQYGNRLIMMDAGRIVVDVRGEEKKNLSVRDLLEKFNVENDRMLLSE